MLASPRVLVLNKQRAEIQLGQRLGYATVTQNLTSTVQQIQFLNTGTLLRFRPVHLDRRHDPDGGPPRAVDRARSSNNLPQSNTSEVTTNVMVPDGATIVIGGLIENDDDTEQQGTLGLSRLPVVGPLFRQKTADDDQARADRAADAPDLEPVRTARRDRPCRPDLPAPPSIGLRRRDRRPETAARGTRRRRRPRRSDPPRGRDRPNAAMRSAGRPRPPAPRRTRRPRPRPVRERDRPARRSTS